MRGKKNEGSEGAEWVAERVKGLLGHEREKTRVAKEQAGTLEMECLRERGPK